MSAKPKIYVLDPYHPNAIATLKEESRNLGLFQPGPDDVRKEAPGNFDLVLPDDPKRATFLEEATLILIRSESKLDASVIKQAGPQLKYIVKQGVGVDNIDLDACSEKGIQVYNTPGINGEAVAELTISLAFTVARRVCEFDRQIHEGVVPVRSQMLGKSLYQKTIGIIGMGNVGLEVARKWLALTSGRVVGHDLRAFGAAWTKDFSQDQFERASSLEHLLMESDVVSVHVPLLDSTRNMIGASEFAKMRDGAILINCARGGIVDEKALLEALQSERLFGAALDAHVHEPPSREHYGEILLKHPRVVMTPHVGASTEENQARSGVAAVDIAVSLIEGRREQIPQALNIVTAA